MTKPFVLKDAIIGIMQSDDPEILKHRGYGGGFNNKALSEILKNFYGQNINMFSITSLLMRDSTFVSVGKLHYVLDKNRMPIDEKELTSRISGRAIIQNDKPSFVQENSGVPLTNAPTETDAADPAHIGIAESKTEPSEQKEETEKKTPLEKEHPNKQDLRSLKDAVLKVIWDNREALEYRDGFGAYEVRTLLSKMGIAADEHEIETVMENSRELDEIEDGYYVYYGEWQGNLVEESEPEEETPDEPVEVETDEPKEDETALVSMNPASDHSSVKLVINGREMNACQKLEGFISQYRQWYEGLRKNKDLSVRYRESVKRTFDGIERCIERLENGVRILRSNEQACKSFLYMNEAMLLQRIKTKHCPAESVSWYPFQLAYILQKKEKMSLPIFFRKSFTAPDAAISTISTNWISVKDINVRNARMI